MIFPIYLIILILLTWLHWRYIKFNIPDTIALVAVSIILSLMVSMFIACCTMSKTIRYETKHLYVMPVPVHVGSKYTKMDHSPPHVIEFFLKENDHYAAVDVQKLPFKENSEPGYSITYKITQYTSLDPFAFSTTEGVETREAITLNVPENTIVDSTKE